MLAWQRVDVHPYEEAEGKRRLLQMPGSNVAVIGEKTGKSEAHIYSRMKLLDLIDTVAPSLSTSSEFTRTTLGFRRQHDARITFLFIFDRWLKQAHLHN